MIKYEMNKGVVKIQTEGSGPELVADVLALVHAIHAEISKKDLFAGLLFEHAFRASIDIAFDPSQSKNVHVVNDEFEGKDYDEVAIEEIEALRERYTNEE